MAAAEVRALWQRTANRCFVQEDAKRAPKLACCQSSCATSKLVEAAPASIADQSDHTAVNVIHFNRKSSFTNVSPDSRWLLHLQPNYGCQKGVTYEQLNALEDEVETLKASDENKTFSKNSQAFPELIDVMAKHETMEIDSVGCSTSKQTNDLFLESDYPWIEGNKTEPWWRTTDRDDLASFVSQRSLNHIENCDLPPPRKKHFRGHACAGICDDKMKTASFDMEAKTGSVSNLTAHALGSLDSGLMLKKQGLSANEGLLYFASDKSSSYNTVHDDVTKNQQIFEGDPSKAQLMEALCHSQTRAREAEEAAKQAYSEKEHIVALIFKQASQLLAYKQWCQLLQLETLYSQIKNKDQAISTLFPVALPWMSNEGRKPRKRKQKFSNGKQERQGIPKYDITTHAIALALGFSLVGAGLLLGWTVGWMLPRL